MTTQSEVDGNHTKNQDIDSMTTVIDKANIEINGSASGGLAGVTAADLLRWSSYIAEIREYAKYIVSQPSPLDMPRTSDMILAVVPPPVLTQVQNQAANDLVRMLQLERIELMKSQSSGMSSGLIPQDFVRLNAVLQKCDNRLELVTANEVVDTPQTLPQFGNAAVAANIV